MLKLVVYQGARRSAQSAQISTPNVPFSPDGSLENHQNAMDPFLLRAAYPGNDSLAAALFRIRASARRYFISLLRNIHGDIAFKGPDTRTRITRATIFFCHIGLLRAPLYLGGVPLVPGVSTLPPLLGIAILERFHDPYGIPPHVTHFVVVFSFRTNTDLPWHTSYTTSLLDLVARELARQD